MQALRSLLFVPAIRPDRFSKALDAGADAVCFDLEDSVAPTEKVQARSNIPIYLSLAVGSCLKAIRVNSIMGADGVRDLMALAEAPQGCDALLIPKVESVDVVRLAASLLQNRSIPIIALIESIAGLRMAEAIARLPEVEMLCFGSADYAAEIGCSTSERALAAPRAAITQAAAAAGIGCLDGAWLQINDGPGLAEDCTLALDMGFSGKPAIHPGQIAAINKAFSPNTVTNRTSQGNNFRIRCCRRWCRCRGRNDDRWPGSSSGTACACGRCRGPRARTANRG